MTRRKDGRWEYRISAGLRDGKPYRQSVYGKTRAEAVAAGKTLRKQIDAGVCADRRLTVARFADEWARVILPRRGLKTSTVDGYLYCLRRYALPVVGHVRLVDLGPRHVSGLLEDLAARDYAVRTQRQVRTLLGMIMKEAVRQQLVERNVVALVDAPRGQVAKLDDHLSLEQAKSLLVAAEEHRLGALVVLALFEGLRKGELLALKWDQLDWDASTIRINGTVKRLIGVRASRPGAGLIVDTPKTAASRRTVVLAQASVAALRAHRRRQSAERLAAGSVWQDNGLIFASPTGGLIDPATVTREYHQISIAAGLGPHRFHALRHTTATLLLNAGMPLELISNKLGHAGLAITADIYAHFGEALKRQTADAMDELFATANV